jgi:heparin binding hemagglutinin HbhA
MATRATSTTPLFAVVGVTDLAVERVRAAAAGASAAGAQFEARMSAVQADVEKRVSEFDPKSLRAQAQEAPTRAAARALEAASKAEARYEELAKRGKELVDRIRSQTSTQDLVTQAGNTLSRGKSAVTIARRAADDTASAIRDTLNLGRTEAATVVTTVVQEAEVDTETAARKTTSSARKTAATGRKRAAATKSAVKGVRTSTGKTSTSAGRAVKNATKKVGD